MYTTIVARAARMDVHPSSSMILSFLSENLVQPRARMATWMPTTTQGFFVQCRPKFGGAEICKTKSTMEMSKQEHLRIVVCGHDDTGQGITTGHRGGVPVRKFDFAEDSCILATMLSTTSQGFAKCWSKFGGMETCKTRSAMGMSKQDTWKIRDFITLGGSARSEFVTGAFLGPCEELDAETDVVNGLFFVFGLTFRQTPCTMVKISVQQRMGETLYQNLVATPSEMSTDVILMLSFVYDIAFVVVSLTECPDSEFNLESCLKDPKRMRSNTTISGDHKKAVFLDAILLVACQACPRTRTTSQQQVADTNSSSAQWKINVRRLHHRGREGK